MRPLFAILIVALAPSLARGAEPRDPLARARSLYNQRLFTESIAAAEDARRLPDRVDAADLIAARAYLERYRDSGSSDDLNNARERLGRINTQKFSATELIELIVGLGEVLYFDGSSGAAAQVFDSVLAQDYLSLDSRNRVLDWWANAVDRDARLRPDLERQVIYQKIRERMSAELARNPANATASYWAAAAARGQGDLQGAWDAAEAAWVRASLGAHGRVLREDLDQLVQRAIIPERARLLGQPPDGHRLEWNRFKDRWNGR